MVKWKSFCQASVYIPTKLVAKNNCGKFSFFITHPVSHSSMPNINKILLKKFSDFFVNLWPTAKPSFHHLRRKGAISIPTLIYRFRNDFITSSLFVLRIRPLLFFFGLRLCQRWWGCGWRWLSRVLIISMRLLLSLRDLVFIDIWWSKDTFIMSYLDIAILILTADVFLNLRTIKRIISLRIIEPIVQYLFYSLPIILSHRLEALFF